MKNKQIDIENPDDFKAMGFKDCPNCGWSLDAETFSKHTPEKCEELRIETELADKRTTLV